MIKKIRKLFVKLYMFIISERVGKYILSIFLCVALLAGFGVLNQDLISDVISIAIGFLISSLLLGLMKVVLGNFEDAVKVTGDTQKLLKMYEGTKKTVCYNGTEGYVAYSEVVVNEGYTFRVQDDENSVYELPDFVGDNFVDLFGAHARSTKHNFDTIRLDGFEKTGGGEYLIKTGRSTFYNHLLTNRACDYRLEDDLTLRDLYEYGPKISSIEASKMSNHIGVNALVYLSDGELLIPRRKNDSTISKNMITSSIATRLLFPKDNGEINAEYLLKTCVLDALLGRLKFDPKWLETKDIQVEFLGFGQNLYEVGKPQFYYAVHIRDLTRLEYLAYIQEHFKDRRTRIDEDKRIYVVKMDTLQFHDDDELKFSYYKLTKTGETVKRVHPLMCEKSFICNIWHEQELQRRKAE